MYHIAVLTKQAFPAFDKGPLSNTLSNGGNNFSINYGIGGIAVALPLKFWPNEWFLCE